MGKLLLFLSFVSLGILALGTILFPDSSAFWLASHAAGYEWARIVLMLLLGEQLITDPPRNIIFRLLSGSIASSVLLWALIATYSNNMQFLDSLALIAAALAIGITALERKVVTRRIPIQFA